MRDEALAQQRLQVPLDLPDAGSLGNIPPFPR